MNRRKKSKQCKKVLLVGEANSGKSSLLNKVFGIIEYVYIIDFIITRRYDRSRCKKAKC